MDEELTKNSDCPHDMPQTTPFYMRSASRGGLFAAAVCPEVSAPVHEELPVAAFAPVPSRETGGDAALRQ